MQSNEVVPGAVFYTATGKWLVTEKLPDGKWMARMTWKRNGSEVSPYLAEGIEFDRDDLGGCDTQDRFSADSG